MSPDHLLDGCALSGLHSQPLMAIRFDNVTKAFDDELVLDGVSFEVPRGTACCIMGRSGTGKSVTLKLLLGLLKPDEGKIYVNDVEIEALDSRRLVVIAQKRAPAHDSSVMPHSAGLR